jgi:hypothetical protein
VAMKISQFPDAQTFDTLKMSRIRILMKYVRKTNKWEAKVPVKEKLPEPELMSNEDNEKFLAQAKINVPIEEKSQYEDLWCKHMMCLARTMDLGKAKKLEHKIDLKKHSPVCVKQFPKQKSTYI